ncbi:hypothetical protein HRbin33_02340 [bacterium HR33]|nr:hypothetical protein HRbin33_02340 [bacterium HR33]
MRSGGWFRGALQIAAIAAASWFLVRTAAVNWGTLSLGDIRPREWLLAAASLITAVTYIYVVIWWLISLGWWGPRPPLLDALRIWFVTNLARFIPGMVWQFAGLVALVRPFGVSAVAATGGVVLQQVLLLAAGAGLIAATAPSLLGGWTAESPAWVPLASVAGATALLVLVVPRAIPLMGRLAGMLLKRPVSWPAPPRKALVAYLLGMVPVWVLYGVAFWLFARSLFGSSAPDLILAGTAFVASYLLGVLAVFAPGGILVREAALVATLSPAMGGAPALVLAVAARVWLLALELAVTFAVLLAHRVVKPRPAAAK